MTISGEISVGLILRSRCKSIDKILCAPYNFNEVHPPNEGSQVQRPA